MHTDELPPGHYLRAWHEPSWKGAFRGEYEVAAKHWDFFCPTWHGGQAVKALAQAYRVTGNEKWLASAREGADFIVRNILTAGPDAGLLLAYEDRQHMVNTSALFEALDGLFVLAWATAEASRKGDIHHLGAEKRNRFVCFRERERDEYICLLFSD